MGEPASHLVRVYWTCLLIFGICAAVPPLYAKFSLSIALGFYSLNLLASLFEPSFYIIFSLIIKGIFIYFLVIGLMEAIKFHVILKKMERLNIIPYKTWKVDVSHPFVELNFKNKTIL